MIRPIPKKKRMAALRRQTTGDSGASIYCILWAGKYKGLEIVYDGKGVRETLSDPPSIVYPMPRHLLQQTLVFEEMEPSKRGRESGNG